MCTRQIVGWAIDSKQDSTLLVKALDRAIRARTRASGGILQANHAVRFTSWLFTEKIHKGGRLSSFGAACDGLNDAMMKSF